MGRLWSQLSLFWSDTFEAGSWGVDHLMVCKLLASAHSLHT